MKSHSPRPHPQVASTPMAKPPALRAATATGGQALDRHTQAEMSARFGHDFSAVRIHTGAQAQESAQDAGANAFAHGTDVVFGAGQYTPGSPSAERLLAHELTHVVQQAQHGSGDPMRASSRSDASEREAERVSADVAAGETVSVEAHPGAAVARGVFGWIEDKAEGAYDAVSDVASDAYDGVSDAASDAWDWTKDEASDAWDTTKGAASTVYGGMKTAAGYVKKGEQAFEGGVDWAEDKITGGANWLADKADGIPVLDSLAHGGAWLVNKQAQLAGGVLKGAGSLVGGLGQMVVDPVDAAKGLEALGEHVPTEFMGIPNPLKAAHGLINVASGDESWGDYANHTFNPVQSLKDDADFGKNMVNAVTAPYSKEIGEGKWAEAGGRALFDIGSLFMGAGEVNAAAKTGDVARAGELAADAARVEDVADLAKADDAANLGRDAAKADEASNAGRAENAVEAGNEVPRHSGGKANIENPGYSEYRWQQGADRYPRVQEALKLRGAEGQGITAAKVEELRGGLMAQTGDAGDVSRVLGKNGIEADANAVGSVKEYNFDSQGIGFEPDNYNSWSKLAAGQGTVGDARYMVHELEEVRSLEQMKKETGFDYLGKDYDKMGPVDQKTWGRQFNESYLKAHGDALGKEYEYLAQQVTEATGGKVKLSATEAAAIDGTRNPTMGKLGSQPGSDAWEYMKVDGKPLQEHPDFEALRQQAAGPAPLNDALRKSLGLPEGATYEDLFAAVKRQPLKNNAK